MKTGQAGGAKDFNRPLQPVAAQQIEVAFFDVDNVLLIVALGHGLLLAAAGPNLLGAPFGPDRDRAWGGRVLDDPIWGARVMSGQPLRQPH